MSGEIHEQATEACSNKALGDGEIIFFATGMTMQQHQCGLNFAPRLQRCATRLQFGSQLVALHRCTRHNDGLTEQAWRLANGEGFNPHAMLSSVRENVTMVVLQGSARWADEPTASNPSESKEGNTPKDEQQ